VNPPREAQPGRCRAAQGRGQSRRGAGRRLPLRNVGHQQRRVSAAGDAAHSVSPRRQVSCERGNDPEPERSRHACAPRRRALAGPITRCTAVCAPSPTTPLPPGNHRCQITNHSTERNVVAPRPARARFAGWVSVFVTRRPHCHRPAIRAVKMAYLRSAAGQLAQASRDNRWDPPSLFWDVAAAVRARACLDCPTGRLLCCSPTSSPARAAGHSSTQRLSSAATPCG
jgi:hypothetical protein